MIIKKVTLRICVCAHLTRTWYLREMCAEMGVNDEK